MNFNALAWRAPRHGDNYGYLPDDAEYENIVKWINSGTIIWNVVGENIVSSRVRFDNNNYDAIVEVDKTTKLIGWTFRARNEFHIN